MASLYGHGNTLYNLITPQEETAHADDMPRIKKELDLLKNANPFRMAEMALEIQIERLRVAEITKARDAALQRLSDAYVSIRQKTKVIDQLQQERDVKGLAPFPINLSSLEERTEIDSLKAHIVNLESIVEELRSTVRRLQRQLPIGCQPLDPPPRYQEDALKPPSTDIAIQTDAPAPIASGTVVPTSISAEPGDDNFTYITPTTDDPVELVKSRNAVLSAIPLPSNPPDVTLTAIVIPPPFTLNEFLNCTSGTLKTSLANYRALYNITTCWCPDREEHGYMYVPAFKCSTNPRIATAHRWSAADVIGRMNKPIECFYNKEGMWYYAGSYKAFRLDDLSVKEWAQLSPETTSAIVKETLFGRKNSSPQNTYETSQLYAAGALKVACVGLQCVGFNQTVYKSILEHAAQFGQTKWKSLTTASANVLAAAGGGGSVQSGPKTSGVANRSRTPNRTKLSMPTPSPSNLSPAMTSGLGPGSSTWNTTGMAACANSSTQKPAASSTDKSTTAKESDEKP
ncbi:hypothetical protein BYT27DRAFT_7198244 [Phlegmacium glaucopus]|nr:hypothetical protein BYT27DRAFT_7198244 [Phlegmacium glaucopus]